MTDSVNVQSAQVTVELPKVLGRYSDGNHVVSIEGNTPQEALQRLIAKYPDLRIRLVDSDECVYPYLVLFLNHRRLTPDQMDQRQLKSGDVMTIATLASGG